LITSRSGINYLFVAASDNGLFRSSDNGKNWMRLTNGLTNDRIISFLSHNNYLFVGTDNGIFRSSDDGINWTNSKNGFGIKEKSRINCFTSNDKFIFAGANTDGIFRSSDDGNSWVKVHTAVNRQQVLSLCVKGSLLFAGTSLGIYVSSDNGDKWLAANNGLPTNMIYPNTNGLIRQVVSNINYINGKLFAGLEQLGLFVSTDNGSSWKVTAKEFYISAIIGDSENLFLSSQGRVFLSTDIGKTWTPFDTKPISHCIISAVDHSNLYACSSNGIFLSPDFGKNWIACNKGLSKTGVNKFAIKGNTLFAATYINGLFRSTRSEERRVGKEC
jgi:photosystem II stability/assembly factor-like uncharacterized protein